MGAVLYVLCSLILIGSPLYECLPRIKLSQGDVQGYHKTSYKGRTFSAFEGIPYAKAPIGELRFREPLPADKWNGLLIANRSTSCSQRQNGKFSGSEDCLFLNVYVPKENVNSNDKIDVVIHIHGGAFKKGSALTDALPDYIMDKDLIVVTLNYRLGVLGFLSTGDATVPGNNGLKDQSLALKWVKNNIKQFGGNPDSITLTGFSVGGVSVHFHLLSPSSAGLFHRAYSISGTALNPRSLEKKPQQRSKEFSANLKCPIDNSEEMVKCLRKISVKELTNTAIEFRPTVEKENPTSFIVDHPYDVIKKKNVFDVPWVSTNVADEAFFLINDIYKDKAALEVYNNWIVRGSKLLELNDTVQEGELVNTLEKLKEKYFGTGELTEDEAIDRLNKVMSDRHFFVGSDLVLRSQAAAMKSPLYYSLSKFVPEDYLQCGGKATAASHCTDNRLLFKHTTNPDVLKPKEEKMMFILTQFLETYAKTGIPKLGDEKWFPIDPLSDSLNVLSIESPDSIQMTKKDELICRKFWNSLPINENDKLY